MTGDTFTDEKTPQSPVSPTGTDTTLRGDAYIEVADENSDCHPTVLAPMPTTSNDVDVDIESAQPSFQASDTNFALYRSFSYLHSRVLLDLQDEITCLERELDEIDCEDAFENPTRLKSRDYDIQQPIGEGADRSRRVILREIKAKLIEYDEVLIKARELQSFQKPSDRNYRSVRRYCFKKKPLMDDVLDSIRTKEDIVTIHNGREWASFDGGVETMIGQTDRFLKKVFNTEKPPLQKYFRTPEAQKKTSDSDISYYSSSRVDKLVNILITFIIFCLLVVPVITMYQLTNTAAHIETDPSGKTSAQSQVDINKRDTFNAVGVLIATTIAQ
ncbi:hypothetical protein J4E86_003106 [Alternaria arbusti]|uniref:uncharacterized protein n=1 Tax=Alternaria arbusti TaxID=232088 RepID=UPI00221E5C59|nr:uncharacterized protein J4E86_003106 [Alternaria arbusti]KAI4959384.1 hypothetical protein J4E86_003106 [Alternaria arbusti]